MQSHTAEICPRDSRRRYWAKVVRADALLPQPVHSTTAYDIPGPFLQRGEEELLQDDVLFEGEANHHRRTDRGWSYCVSVVDKLGNLYCAKSGEFGELRKALKAAGMDPHLLKGSGDIAAMVRVAHAVRDGLLSAATGGPDQDPGGDPEQPGGAPGAAGSGCEEVPAEANRASSAQTA